MKARAAAAAIGAGAASLAWAAYAAGGLRAAGPAPAAAGAAADAAPDAAARFVSAMIEKYGRPDRVEGGRFVWDRRGPFLRISVRDELSSAPGAEGEIEETIDYSAPAAARAALGAFSLGLSVSGDGKLLSARSGGEERNYLMLNLADAVASGRLTPEDARLSYVRTLELDAAGKTSASMHRLLFRAEPVTKPGQTGDAASMDAGSRSALP